jgi:uncharacterized protein (DUF362 family)
MMSRRDFIQLAITSASFIFSGCISGIKDGEKLQEEIVMEKKANIEKSEVFVIKTNDRKRGIKKLVESLPLDDFSGRKIAVKANYNSADPFPASTHRDTLSAIVEFLQQNKAEVVLAERSGMGATRRVLEERGVIELSRSRGFEVIVLDELDGTEWVKVKLEDGHWKRGFLFPKIFKEADGIVQTCCLKTHRFGGHFTMSLKNSVGMVAKYDPLDGYNYMSELHTSRAQRKMIAEINTAYIPEFIVMDAIQGFSTGGPDTGTIINPGILMASKDRIAIDAVGVAILRLYGTTPEVSRGRIFEQEQIARAVELGLGATTPEQIEVIPINNEAQNICSRIKNKLEE